MSVTLNTSANKPFLQNTMSQVLAYGQQATWTGTVSQTTTTLTFHLWWVVHAFSLRLLMSSNVL